MQHGYVYRLASTKNNPEKMTLCVCHLLFPCHDPVVIGIKF